MKKKYIVGLSILIGLIAFGGVLFLLVKKRQEAGVLVLFGNVDVRQVDLGFRVSGRVVNMPFQEGDLVMQGDFMAALEKQPYTDLAEEAKAAMESARFSYENAEKLFLRRNELIGSGGISQEDYDNVFSSKNVYWSNLKQAEASLGVALKNLQDTEICSPAEGTILTRIREPGAVVNVGDPIYTLSLISPVWVRTFVSELELGLIYPGMPAEIFTDTPGGKVYKGHVGFISPVAEFTPKTVETTQLRTDLVYRLRVIADNPDKVLKQGMPVTVKLYLKECPGAL